MISAFHALAGLAASIFLIIQVNTVIAGEPAWDALSSDERRVLKPLSQDWTGLSGYLRTRLIRVADCYSQLSTIQQRRVSARLLEWSKLSPNQRTLARKRYRDFMAFSIETRREIVAQWLKRNAANDRQLAAGPDLGN
jgi:uncharacterized protein DUF3106